MDRARLAELQRVTGVRAQSVELKLTAIRREEARLRSEIDRLRNGLAAPIDLENRTIYGATGLHIAWKRWTEERIEDLNTRLARCLAQREALLARFRRTRAQALAAEEISSVARAAHDRKTRESALSLILEQEALAAISSPGARFRG